MAISAINVKVMANVEHQETLAHLRSITPNTINHFASQSPLLFLVMYVVCSRGNKVYVFVSSPKVHLDYRNMLYPNVPYQ